MTMKINKGIQGHIWVTIFMLLPILLLYFINPVLIKEKVMNFFYCYITVQLIFAIIFSKIDIYDE